MWLLLFIALFVANPSPRQLSAIPAQRPPLIVQVVDPAWFPIPGAEVKVEPENRSEQPSLSRTDSDGYAKFFVTADADCTIEVKSPGFKPERLKNVRLAKASATFPTAYVQLRLQKFSGKPITVY
jgi:hypothetical protein